jgi:1-acyl-sn-glycerol-3-phosphate acyltransferase
MASLAYVLWARMAGAAVAVGAAALLSAAFAQFRRETGEMPWAAFGSRELLQNGVYRYWRHPIPLFSTLLVAGLGLAFASGTLIVGGLPTMLVGAIGLAWWQERGRRRRDPERYLGHRRRTGLFVPRLVHWLRPGAWVVARTLFRFRVRHLERLPASGPYVVLAAHCSCLDLLWVSLAIPQPIRFVVDFELFRGRAMAWLLDRLFALRSRPHTEHVPRARAVTRAIKEGFIVALFPECERSWTGELGPLRPELLQLLPRLKVPVVPLRVDGSGLVWPRWRDRPGRAPIRVTVQPPLEFGFFDSMGLIENRLAAFLRPHESALRAVGTPNASGIGRLLYRCPTCRRRWPLLRAARTTFECPRCHVPFVLTAEHQVRFLREERSLPELHRTIRLTRPDLPRLARSRCPIEGLALGKREGYLDHAEVCFQHESKGRPRQRTWGTLVLTTERLILHAGESSNLWSLDGVGSVAVRGRDELWIVPASRQVPMRWHLPGRSALYWRDLVTLAVANATRSTPSRT